MVIALALEIHCLPAVYALSVSVLRRLDCSSISYTDNYGTAEWTGQWMPLVWLADESNIAESSSHGGGDERTIAK